jgi:hypothetical protein
LETIPAADARRRAGQFRPDPCPRRTCQCAVQDQRRGIAKGLSVFGQALETRFARSVSLLTGALPAQYGFFTAGVLDIQTKTGLTNPGLALTMYGGSFNWLEPSFEYGGHEGPVDWFFTGDH